MDIREKLQCGLPAIGTWMQIASSEVGEILGSSGYDWVAVDLEHGQFSSQTLPQIFRSIEHNGTLPFARVAVSNMSNIKQALDAGAKGLILPMIENHVQLQEAISNSFYPPIGKRGVGYCRANLYGKKFDEYLEKSKDILIVAQIEHINAVKNLDEILKVKGLDAIMIGPYDLTGSMNITGQFENPEFLKILDDIFNKVKKTDVSMGFHIVQNDELLLKKKIEEGYQFLAYGIDTVFLINSSKKPSGKTTEKV